MPFLLSFFILMRLTNRQKKKDQNTCKIDFREEAYSFTYTASQEFISVLTSPKSCYSRCLIFCPSQMYGVLTFHRSNLTVGESTCVSTNFEIGHIVDMSLVVEIIYLTMYVLNLAHRNLRHIFISFFHLHCMSNLVISSPCPFR